MWTQLNPGQSDRRDVSRCRRSPHQKRSQPALTSQIPTAAGLLLSCVLPSVPLLSDCCRRSSNWAANVPRALPAPARGPCLDCTVDLLRSLTGTLLTCRIISKHLSATCGALQRLPGSSFCVQHQFTKIASIYWSPQTPGHLQRTPVASLLSANMPPAGGNADPEFHSLKIVC